MVLCYIVVVTALQKVAVDHVKSFTQRRIDRRVEREAILVVGARRSWIGLTILIKATQLQVGTDALQKLHAQTPVGQARNIVAHAIDREQRQRGFFSLSSVVEKLVSVHNCVSAL